MGRSPTPSQSASGTDAIWRALRALGIVAATRSSPRPTPACRRWRRSSAGGRRRFCGYVEPEAGDDPPLVASRGHHGPHARRGSPVLDLYGQCRRPRRPRSRRANRNASRCFEDCARGPRRDVTTDGPRARSGPPAPSRSIQPKNLGALGDGGAVVGTGDPALAESPAAAAAVWPGGPLRTRDRPRQQPPRRVYRPRCCARSSRTCSAGNARRRNAIAARYDERRSP